MRTEDVERCAEEMMSEIEDSPAMDPSLASQQDSLDFLGSLVETIQLNIYNIKHDMKRDGGAE